MPYSRTHGKRFAVCHHLAYPNLFSVYHHSAYPNIFAVCHWRVLGILIYLPCIIGGYTAYLLPVFHVSTVCKQMPTWHKSVLFGTCLPSAIEQDFSCALLMALGKHMLESTDLHNVSCLPSVPYVELGKHGAGSTGLCHVSCMPGVFEETLDKEFYFCFFGLNL